MSTAHDLLELVEGINTSLNDNKYAVGKVVVLEKVFNNVNHDILKIIILLWYSWNCKYMDFKLTSK